MMKNPTIERYIDSLLEKSTPTRPVWNMEAIRQGKAPSWNYVDGCYDQSKFWICMRLRSDKRYAEFADAFIDYQCALRTAPSAIIAWIFNLDNINAARLFLNCTT